MINTQRYPFAPAAKRERWSQTHQQKDSDIRCTAAGIAWLTNTTTTDLPSGIPRE